VNCGSYGTPPGGVWIYQYDYNQCIQEVCGPYTGNWKAYTSSDGCCVYGLFISCQYDFWVCPV
jgi:hypothetical protein